MTSSTVNYSFRVDREIKRQCETMFNELGMNMTTAINIFLRDPTVKRYSDVDKALTALKE